MPLSDYPGMTALAPELQAGLRRLASGDDTGRAEVLRTVADALNVFVGLGLLEYVFVTGADPDETAPTIDLVAPAPEPRESIAWFTVDEAGYDEFRDAVTLLGDFSEILNPPIVLDMDDEASGGLY